MLIHRPEALQTNSEQFSTFPKTLARDRDIDISRARAGRRDATAELTKTAAKLKPPAWPYPMVELYLGRKSLQAAEAAASKPEEKCEAQFYIGEFHLTRNARPLATKALQSAADTCPKDFVEYRAAVEELKRLKP